MAEIKWEELPIRCRSAVNVLAPRLETLYHGHNDVSLVKFRHDSPGLRELRKRTAEALVYTLEQNGYEIRPIDGFLGAGTPVPPPLPRFFGAEREMADV